MLYGRSTGLSESTTLNQETNEWQSPVLEDLPDLMEISDSSAPINSTAPPVPPSPCAQRYFKRPFTDVGRIFGYGQTPYVITMEEEVDSDNYAYPFTGLKEWKLAHWLSTSKLSQANINSFLSLDLIIENLPGTPDWKSQWIRLPEAPNDPQLLLYRNPVECLEWLEANPEFSDAKDYLPYEEYLEPDFHECVYSEITSGTAWNTMQCEYPEQVTILPYIITSDSTHLTNFSGDKKIKPVIISNTHIHQHVVVY